MGLNTPSGPNQSPSTTDLQEKLISHTQRVIYFKENSLYNNVPVDACIIEQGMGGGWRAAICKNAGNINSAIITGNGSTREEAIQDLMNQLKEMDYSLGVHQ